MKKTLLLLDSLVLSLFLIGCVKEVSEEGLAKELGNLSEEELSYVLSEDEKALAGQAFDPKSLSKLNNLNKQIKPYKITCSDSDGGRNYEQAGGVTLFNYPGGAIKKSDRCWKDNKRLQEYVCENNKYKGDHTFDCLSLGKNYVCEGGACVIPDFQQSYALNYTVAGKTQFSNCVYDTYRNNVAIIIKKNGVYDNEEVINTFEQYFSAVQNHLNIDNVGVKKFDGSTINQLDEFIEYLVKDELVGYTILVGTDLPIVRSYELQLVLDFNTINRQYSLVDKDWFSGNWCIDVAISSVIAPQRYSDQEKRTFVMERFLNYKNYHENPSNTFSNFNEGTLIIECEDNTFFDPEMFTEEDTIYFYEPISYIRNTDHQNVQRELQKKHLLLKYNVHGGYNSLGLGFNPDSLYVNNNEVIEFFNQYGQPALFIDAEACGQNWLSPLPQESFFCCWPQTWLSTNVWTSFYVSSVNPKYKFERHLFGEKVVGKALRKTYHAQSMIYGDILGTFP